jgi:DDE family transposase
MDATDDPSHGQQELEFYHGYYGRHCFLPLLVFCSVDGGSQELVGAILRPGNAHSGRRSAAILKRLALMLKAAFPLAELHFRADAGFALPEVYETCEELGISYVISLARNSRLQEMADPLMAKARLEKQEKGAKVRLFDEILYKAGTWTKERRVIVKAEIMDKGENPRFVVTNRSGAPEALYDEYCLRGDCENRIKEMKLDLFSGRTSCHRFLANAFRLLLHALAFVLLSEVRRMLAGTGLAKAALGQIRIKILKIAALVQTSTRRILVRLPRGHPHAELIQSMLA